MYEWWWLFLRQLWLFRSLFVFNRIWMDHYKVIFGAIKFRTLWFFIKGITNLQELDFHWVKFYRKESFISVRKRLTFNWGLDILSWVMFFVSVIRESIKLIITSLFDFYRLFDFVLQHFAITTIFLCDIRCLLSLIQIIIKIIEPISINFTLIIRSYQSAINIDLVNLFIVFVR